MEGDGFFDTSNKKIVFKTIYGERQIDILWDKKDKAY